MEVLPSYDKYGWIAQKDENNVTGLGKKGLSLNVLRALPVGLLQCSSTNAYTQLCTGAHGAHIVGSHSRAYIVGLMQCSSTSAYTQLCTGAHGAHIGPEKSKASALAYT